MALGVEREFPCRDEVQTVNGKTMTKEQRAVELFLQSVEDCRRRDPVAPTLRAADVIVCQGATRNRALEAQHG